MADIQKTQLNQDVSWIGNLEKINGVKLEKPTQFTIRRLTIQDSAAMDELSALVYRHLGRGEKCFIHQRKEGYFFDMLDKPDYHYIGVFAGTKLIGLSSLHVCRDHQTFGDEIPCSPVNFFQNNPTTKVAAFGADSVHPAYRGNGLNQLMVEYRLELAAHLGCTDAASIVDRNNHWNMPPYFNNGFCMYGTGIDPDDNGKIALMHLHLQTKPKPQAKGYALPYNRFDLIDKMLQRGFVGVGYNKTTAQIIFAPHAQTIRSCSMAAPKTNVTFLSAVRIAGPSGAHFLSLINSHQVQRV